MRGATRHRPELPLASALWPLPSLAFTHWQQRLLVCHLFPPYSLFFPCLSDSGATRSRTGPLRPDMSSSLLDLRFPMVATLSLAAFSCLPSSVVSGLWGDRIRCLLGSLPSQSLPCRTHMETTVTCGHVGRGSQIRSFPFFCRASWCGGVPCAALCGCDIVICDHDLI